MSIHLSSLRERTQPTGPQRPAVAGGRLVPATTRGQSTPSSNAASSNQGPDSGSVTFLHPRNWTQHLATWLIAAALILGLTTAGRAQSATNVTTLTFNELGASPFGTHMPTNHHGFVWGTSDWHFLTGAVGLTNTYLALSGTATSIMSRGGVEFYFDGLTAWSRRGLDANGLFYYILSNHGTNVYDGRDDGNEGKNKFTAVHQSFKPNYTGLVDRVAIVFTQGGDDWDHLAIDDFQFHGRQGVQGPDVISIAKQPSGIQLQFAGQAGEPYRIDAQTDLGTDTWAQLGVATADGTGAVQFTDAETGLTRRFYRAARP